jgi:GT2 family glycosyltransferase
MPEIHQQRPEAPAVSVIIPAYRATRYITTAIDSAFAQTFTDYETIIINDGCPDTAELERALEPYAGQLLYLRQINKGPAGARNAGIRAARGRFLAFLDADDYWAPNYLAEQMRFLEMNPLADMVYADALLVGDSPLAGRTFMDAAPSTGVAHFESLLVGQCTVILSGTVVRRQRVLDVGLFDEHLQRAEDYDLWLRLARSNAEIGYQRKVLLFRRELPTSLCSDKARLFLNEVRVLAKLARQAPLTRSQEKIVAMQMEKMKAAINLEQSKIAFEQTEFRKAAAALQKANIVYNSWKLRMVLFSLQCSPGLLLCVHNYRKRKRIDAT